MLPQEGEGGCGLGGDDAVSEESEPVGPHGVENRLLPFTERTTGRDHPSGQFMSHSTNAGLSRDEMRGVGGNSGPSVDVAGAGRPLQRATAFGSWSWCPRSFARCSGPLAPLLSRAAGVGHVCACWPRFTPSGREPLASSAALLAAHVSGGSL